MENERIIQSQLKNCNFQIEGLESCAKHAPPELGKVCEEMISELAAYREGLNLSLLKLIESNVQVLESGR